MRLIHVTRQYTKYATVLSNVNVFKVAGRAGQITPQSIASSNHHFASNSSPVASLTKNTVFTFGFAYAVLACKTSNGKVERGDRGGASLANVLGSLS